MSNQSASTAQQNASADGTLTQQIAAFTGDAVKRLPPEYLEAFGALIGRLGQEGIGRSSPQIGAAFPDFELVDDIGERVRASDHWKDRAVIVKFYRGGWCPYCNLELAALQRYQQDFAALQAEVLAIAPEKSAAQTATKAKAAATFKFLWDQDNALAHRVGIAFEVDPKIKEIYPKLGIDLVEVNGAWELPVPATFVVRDGIVRHRVIDPNYLQRQDPIELLEWLRADVPNDR